MTPDANDKTLTSYWSTPVPTGRPDDFSAGAPVACIATTYTFDAAFFEVDLLPRFLGVKFDHTEREISFLVEREQALGTVRACVLVDHTCVDARQTTLRWDQMAVRVPGGAQHAKIVVLAWERWLRIIVSSANLTRQGYRRNREIAGVLDFFDGKDSMPLQLAKDVLSFLSDIANTGWVQAHDAARDRMITTLEFVRSRLSRWQQAPADFTPRELPRASFVGGRPAGNGRRMLSVIDQVAALWGTRKATDVAVMTPFVGEAESGMERLAQQLMDLSRRSASSVRTYLAIPGHPSQEIGSKKMISDLPSFFRDSWDSSWGEIQEGPAVFVVPPARKGEKINRVLHAKATSLSDEDRDLLLSGSSNFTPHGMGVGAANVEANLCFQDESNARVRLDARLPVRWYEDDNDSCDDVFWPTKVEPPEDESPRQPALPPVFKAVTFNEQAAKLTVFFDTAYPLPALWSLARPGAKANDTGTVILASRQMLSVPQEGRLTVDMPGSLRGLTLTCVRVAWTDDQGQIQSGWLPVQTESLEDLLPPEQFRGLTSDHIMNCLISGREPAELVDENGDDAGHLSSAAELSRACDPLREIDTTGYALYQVRKLGQTLAALAERLLRTVRTNEAVSYRLRQDPLGPIALADALAKDLTVEGQPPETAQMRASQLAFSFAEIALMLAHACRRVRADRNPGDHDIRPIYREVIKNLIERASRGDGPGGGPGSLAGYIGAVHIKCDELVGAGD
jgi:hypothetical protein